VIEEQELDFLRTFRDRKTAVAYTLFALNILIFILMGLAGGSTNDLTLMAFGAKSNFHIDSGEIWRFVTPLFLHIGVLHLAFNSYALWIVGPQVEKLYGSSRFLLLYVLAGIGGVVASYWYHPDVPSAGASGAIFGLFGVLLVFAIKYRKSVPAFFAKAIGKGVLLTVAINLVIGWQIPQIDNSAHLGGLVTGMLLAAVVPFQKPGETTGPAFKVAQGVLVVVIGLSFFQVATRYNGPSPSLQNLMRGLRGSNTSSIGGFIQAMDVGQRAFEHSEEILSSGDVRKLWEPRKELGDAIKLLQHVPSLSSGADELSADLLDVLQKQYAYVEEVERGGFPASPHSSEYGRVKRQIEAWVESEGAQYGIVNTPN
jgi:membrane associated rhomboid family serine protease